MNRQRAAGAQDGLAEEPPVVTPEIAAEAAVWVARLHGPDRSTDMDRECLAWQARSAAHRLAFERCTDTWQDVSRVTLSDYAHARSRTSTAARGRWNGIAARSAAVLGLVVLVSGAAVLLHPWRDADAYATGVGEQQVVVLDDGTRMSLNTSTRVHVDLSSAQRRVSMQGGEVLFEVAKDAHRPFVVRVAGSEVEALGTVFAVRYTDNGARAGNALAVMLIEGQVTVRPAPDGMADGAAASEALLMKPGERVRLTGAEDGSTKQGGVLQVDRPNIEQMVAWKRSEAIFDNVSLADAVTEMNRYSRTPIVLVGESALTNLRVSGQYRIGDNAGFVRAIAVLHGLSVHERQGRLELAARH